MIKKQQRLEESALTEPETPPPIEDNYPPQSHSHSQLIQRIISSNQQLIHEQMSSIRHLQTANYELESKLKLITDKYEALVEITEGKKDPLPTHPHTPTRNQPVSVDQMVLKIIDLEQQLSTTKVELAVKSAELLTTNFQHHQEDSHSRRRQTLSPHDSREEIQKYLSHLPTEQHSQSSGKKGQGQSKELVEGWSKVYEQYCKFEHKASRFKQKSGSLIRKFIPREMRTKVWPLCIENRLGMTNSLYIHLLERREKGWVDEKVRVQIDKDIKRSFYGKTNYEIKTGIIFEVVEFLQIFHVFRPDISYIQGMTYPAMILIPVLGKIRAFNLFCNLILGNPFFRRLFSMEGNFVSTICRGFEALLEDYLPELSKRLSELCIQSEIYLIEWLFTFFSRGLSIETTLKFWDHLLFFEEVAIFRMGLAIFEQLGPIILELNYEETINFLREYCVNIKEERLLEGLGSHKLSSEKLYKALERAKV